MEQLRAQMQILADEMNSLKAEIVNVKSAHASLHQSTVDSGAQSANKYSEYAARLVGIETKLDSLGLEAGTFADKGFGGPKPPALMKPEQVKVGIFHGGIAVRPDAQRRNDKAVQGLQPLGSP